MSGKDPEIQSGNNCEEAAVGSTRTLDLQDKRASMVMFNICENTDNPRLARSRPSIFSVLSQVAGGSHRPSVFSRLSDLSLGSFSNFSWNYRKLVILALITAIVFIIYMVLILLFYPVTKTKDHPIKPIVI